MRNPTREDIQRLRKVAVSDPVLLTLAPEREGALEAVDEAVKRGMVVSFGHCNASAERLRTGVEAGGKGYTHFRAAIRAAAGKEVKAYSSRDEVQGRVVNREFVPARFDPFQQAHDAVMQILDDSSRPDAIICTNDDRAIGALAALRKRGVSVPKAFSI